LLAPVRIDHEVAGDAVSEPPGHVDPFRRLRDCRVLDQAFQPLVGRRLEAEKNVEFARDRTPCLEQLGMARDEIDAALDEYPFLPDAAAAQFLRELETARG